MSHFALCLAGLAGWSAAAADLPGGPLPLDQVLQETMAQEPETLRARKAWEEAALRVWPARTWPDPMVSYRSETMEADPRERKTEVEVSQAVPFPGKLSADAAMKSHEAKAAWQAYRARSLDALTGAKVAYYRVHRLDRTASILEAGVELLREVTRSAQARLASGKAESGDAFIAQTELEELKNMLFEARQQRRLAAGELNRRRGRPPEDPVGPVSAPVLKDIPRSLEELQGLARRASPMALASMHEVDHALAMRRRASLAFAPDFFFSYALQRRSPGPSGRELGAGLSVPLWLTRPVGERRAAGRHLEGAEAASRAAGLDAAVRVHEEYVETETHLKLARDTRDSLVPVARGAMNVMQRSYASGRSDILKVVEAARSYLRAQTQYEEQSYHFMEHWAMLEREVGAGLDEQTLFPAPVPSREGRHLSVPNGTAPLGAEPPKGGGP